MNNFELVPKISLGIFRLGESIDVYTSILDYVLYPKNEGLVSGFYDFYDFYEGDIVVYTGNSGYIDDISCRKYCYYNGQNLIGLNFDKFIESVSIDKGKTQKDEIYILVNDKGQTQQVYDIDDLGLQIWVYRKKIVTVRVWNPDAYED